MFLKWQVEGVLMTISITCNLSIWVLISVFIHLEMKEEMWGDKVALGVINKKISKSKSDQSHISHVSIAVALEKSGCSLLKHAPFLPQEQNRSGSFAQPWERGARNTVWVGIDLKNDINSTNLGRGKVSYIYPKLAGAALVSVILTGEVLTAAKQTRHWAYLTQARNRECICSFHTSLQNLTLPLAVCGVCFWLVLFLKAVGSKHGSSCWSEKWGTTERWLLHLICSFWANTKICSSIEHVICHLRAKVVLGMA